MRPLIAICTATVLAALAAETNAAGFRGLGDLPGGDLWSTATGISADGSTVVGWGTSATGNRKAFRWTAETEMVDMGYIPGFTGTESKARAVSDDGSVIVGSSRAFSELRSFRWTEAGGMENLGDLPGGDVYGSATALSADGSVVVGYGDSASGRQAYRLTVGDSMVPLGFLPGLTGMSAANAVTADGSVVFGSSVGISSSAHVFRWTESGGLEDLGGLPQTGGMRTGVEAVTPDGLVAVGGALINNNWRVAYRWTESGGFQSLGDLPGGLRPHARAYDVSADGTIVVGSGEIDSGTVAFIWDTAQGMRSLMDVATAEYGLDLTGWRLTGATGISADGTVIVGYGNNPTGGREAWMMTIPEPSTLVLLGMGALALLTLAWRRHRRVPLTPCPKSNKIA